MSLFFHYEKNEQNKLLLFKGNEVIYKTECGFFRPSGFGGQESSRSHLPHNWKAGFLTRRIGW